MLVLYEWVLVFAEYCDGSESGNIVIVEFIILLTSFDFPVGLVNNVDCVQRVGGYYPEP